MTARSRKKKAFAHGRVLYHNSLWRETPLFSTCALRRARSPQTGNAVSSGIDFDYGVRNGIRPFIVNVYSGLDFVIRKLTQCRECYTSTEYKRYKVDFHWWPPCCILASGSFWPKDGIGRVGVIGLEPRYLFLKICVIGRSVEERFFIMEMIKDSNHPVNLSVIGRE